jgi:drug/metabolite transporter (DMT)-like permease
MPGEMRRPVDRRQGSAAAWLALAPALAVMGGQFAVAKRGFAAGLTPADIVALRFGGASVVAFGALVPRGIRRLGGVGWGRGSVLALIAGSPYALLMYFALQYAPATHGAILVPGVGLVVATVIGSSWVGERHGVGRYLGIGIVLVGLAVLSAGGVAAPGTIGLGDLMLAGVGMEWGLFTLLVRRWRLEALAATAALSVVSLVYLPVYVLALRPQVLGAPVRDVLLQVGYQGILQTAFALSGYAFAVRRLGAGPPAIASAAVPVLGTLFAIPVAGEWPSAATWTGLAVVSAGIGVANGWAGRRSPALAGAP